MGSEPMNRKTNDSIRITLRISRECVETIEWLSLRNKITQKQLFEKISQFLLSFTKPDAENPISSFIQDGLKGKNQSERIRKAQVVSKDAYRVIRAFSKRHGVSRDAVIEGIIDCLKSTEKLNAEKNEDARLEAKKIVDNLWLQAEESENEMKRIVGEDDAVLQRLGKAIVILMNLSMDIERELKEGIPVDPEDL